MKDRFDLEQDIMKCWNVIEDIDLLYEAVGDNPKYDMPPSVCDRLMNQLLGIRELYELRFERLFDTFKQTYFLDEYRTSEMERWYPDRDEDKQPDLFNESKESYYGPAVMPDK